jgi:hypothetical protein
MTQTNVLIAPLGASFSVLTASLDALHNEGIRIDRMVVIYPEQMPVDYDLYGPDVMDTLWERCLEVEWRDVYHGRHDQLARIVLPAQRDVRDRQSSLHFMRALWQALQDYQGQRIYLSIAGGRKSMTSLAVFLAQFFDIEKVFHVYTDYRYLTDRYAFAGKTPHALEQLLRIDMFYESFMDLWEEGDRKALLHPPAECLSLVPLAIRRQDPELCTAMWEVLATGISAATSRVQQAMTLLQAGGLLSPQNQRSPLGEEFLWVISGLGNPPHTSSALPANENFALISSLGETPGVVTAAIQSLWEERQLAPCEISIYATRFSEQGFTRYLDEPLMRYTTERYGHRPVRCHVIPHEDIDSPASIADCYQMLINNIMAYQQRGLDVYLNLAGGRKAMSALLMQAAQDTQCTAVFHCVIEDPGRKIESEGTLEALRTKTPAQIQRYLWPPASFIRILPLPVLRA